jgi:hypothetical protein
MVLENRITTRSEHQIRNALSTPANPMIRFAKAPSTGAPWAQKKSRSLDPRAGGVFVLTRSERQMSFKDHAHPSLRRRFGAVTETMCLWGSFASIWVSMGWILVAIIQRL